MRAPHVGSTHIETVINVISTDNQFLACRICKNTSILNYLVIIKDRNERFFMIMQVGRSGKIIESHFISSTIFHRSRRHKIEFGKDFIFLPWLP